MTVAPEIASNRANFSTSFADFIEKVKAGKAKVASSGFGGKGLDKLEQERDQKSKAERAAYGEDDGAKGEDGKDGAAKEGGEAGASGAGKEGGASGGGDGDSGFPDVEIEVKRGPAPDSSRTRAPRGGQQQSRDQPAGAASGGEGGQPVVRMSEANLAALKAAEEEAKKRGINVSGLAGAQSVIAKLTASINAKKQEQFGSRMQGRQSERDREHEAMDETEAARRRDPDATDYHAVVPIGSYGQSARWKVTNKETVARLIEDTGASITTKGVYYEKGKEPGPDDPPALHLLIESNDEMRIKLAISEIKRLLVDASAAALEQAENGPRGGAGGASGRYNVLH